MSSKPMRVGGGWILDWEAVIEWAVRKDPEFHELYHHHTIDTMDRRTLCASKFTVWFQDQTFSRKVGAFVTSATGETVVFLAVYSALDYGGTLKEFKKFHPQPGDQELKEEIARIMDISTENFVWASVPDPCRQDRHL